MKTKHAWIFSALGVITLALSIVVPALSQSNPGFVTGQVPTAAQWNSYFSRKLDYQSTGAYPSVVGVGPLTSPLIINRSGVTAPTPGNGTLLQLIQAAATPNRIELYGNGISGTGAGGVLMAARSSGTPAAPVAIEAGLTILDLQAGGYDGTSWALRKSAVSFATAALWSVSSTPTQVQVATTPTGSTTLRTVAIFGQDGSLTLPVGYGTGGLVSVGAADSCGSGYKCLRVPN